MVHGGPNSFNPEKEGITLYKAPSPGTAVEIFEVPESSPESLNPHAPPAIPHAEQQAEMAHPAPAPEEVPQDAIWEELDQPLIRDEERFSGLKKKRLAYKIDFSQEINHTLLDYEICSQMGVEIKLERSLRQEGYPPISINANREKIRGLLFYSRGRPLSESTLLSYLEEMEEDFEKSRPFPLIKEARKKGDLPLYKAGDLFFYSFEAVYNNLNRTSLGWAYLHP